MFVVVSNCHLWYHKYLATDKANNVCYWKFYYTLNAYKTIVGNIYFEYTLIFYKYDQLIKSYI